MAKTPVRVWPVVYAASGGCCKISAWCQVKAKGKSMGMPRRSGGLHVDFSDWGWLAVTVGTSAPLPGIDLILKLSALCAEITSRYSTPY
ncbi:hypothetical protein BT67DRAFT_442200 [Trichocladium antarcticum]|uniref:Uncharacterized protein n=1 Tax=Trichocladium antarcticum TaxID=1450529 RepID=A0AAN6ZDX6_9PEZI|nr:hypothetical protein BT67DRAFT_442200 [Trichocladium antarcticum]